MADAELPSETEKDTSDPPKREPQAAASMELNAGPLKFSLKTRDIWIGVVALAGGIVAGFWEQGPFAGRTMLAFLCLFLLGALVCYTFMARHMFPMFQEQVRALHAEVDRCGKEKTKLFEKLLHTDLPSSTTPRDDDKTWRET